MDRASTIDFVRYADCKGSFCSSAIIFGTELRTETSPSAKPAIVFQVLVSRGQEQWVVIRPLNLFAALHAKLRDVFPSIMKRNVPRVPKGKKLRSAPSPVVISRVHRKLQNFLIAVLAEPHLHTSMALDQFLSVGKQPLKEYNHIVQPFLDTICSLGEPGEAPEPKTSPRSTVVSYAIDKGMQGVAQGGLIGLDVRHSGYLFTYQKGQRRERFFQLRGTNALFKFPSAKESVPLEMLDLAGCKLALVQAEDVDGATVRDHCFRLTWSKRNVSVVFSTHSEDDLGRWISHLNNFAFGRADALVRKRIPDIPLLNCKTEPAGHRKSKSMSKAKECNGDEDEDTAELPKQKFKSTITERSLYSSTEVYRVLKRSGSDCGYTQGIRPRADTDSAVLPAITLEENIETTPTPASPRYTKHKRSSSMIYATLSRSATFKESPREEISKQSTSAKAEPVISIPEPKEQRRKPKNPFGSLINRPSFQSHPSLPIGRTPEIDRAAALNPVRSRSATMVVPTRTKEMDLSTEHGVIAFVNQLLDGLAEDEESQGDLEILQMEVDKFLTPNAQGRLPEPLCGHSLQISFLAASNICGDEARLRVIGALLASLPRANRAAMLRLLSFLEHVATRLGKRRMTELERLEEETARRREEWERHRAEPKTAQALRRRQDCERKLDMYKVHRSRQSEASRMPDDVERARPLSAIFTEPPVQPQSPQPSSAELSPTLASASPSDLESCSFVNSCNSGSGDELHIVPEFEDDKETPASVCYSSMIERQIAEERERIYKKAADMKMKAEALSLMAAANTNYEGSAGSKQSSGETRREDGSPQSARDRLQVIAVYRERLAGVFGRVMIASDLPIPSAPRLNNDGSSPDAVIEVAAFMIEHCAQLRQIERTQRSQTSKKNGKAITLKEKRYLERRKAALHSSKTKSLISSSPAKVSTPSDGRTPSRVC